MSPLCHGLLECLVLICNASLEQIELAHALGLAAPHVALLTTEAALGFWGGVDCGLYINSFMLAARSLGVDSIAQAALASYPDFVREYFGLPENRKLVCGISFGYADAGHPINQYRTERENIAGVVRWED